MASGGVDYKAQRPSVPVCVCLGGGPASLSGRASLATLGQCTRTARPAGALFKINVHCSTVTFGCRVSFRRPATRISHPCARVPSCLTVSLFTAPQCVEQSSGTSSGSSLVVQSTQGINRASVSARLPAPPPWCPYICSLHVCLYFCFAENKIISTVFLDSSFLFLTYDAL